MIPLTLSIVLVFLTVVYFYLKSVYFTLRGPIPGVPPHVIFGNLIQTGALSSTPASMVDVFPRFRDRLGDVFQYWMGVMHMIVLNRIEDIQHVFTHRQIYDQGRLFTENLKLLNPNGIICLNGSKYKRHASLTGPLFRRAKILMHFDTIVDCTDRLIDRWRKNYRNPNEVHLNMIKESQQLLMAIFGYIAFDFDLQTLDDQPNRQDHELTTAFHELLRTMQTLFALPISLGRIYLFCNWKVHRARRTIDRYLEEMIEHELKMTPEMRAERKRISLIASLVSSLQRDEQVESAKAEEEKQGLSRLEVKNEMLSFLSAGYGTTSTAVSWFIHLMSKHPAVQQKIKEEMSQFNGQRFTLEQLDSLTYLDVVIREILRYAPTVLGTVRTLTCDDQLPDNGFFLKKGQTVFVSYTSLSRDKRYWSDRYDLNEFHPERFLDDPEGKNNPAAWIPFGGGHRICMGQDLAKFELKIICARLMQSVTFADGGSEVNAGGFDVTDTNRPRKIVVKIQFDSNSDASMLFH